MRKEPTTTIEPHLVRELNAAHKRVQEHNAKLLDAAIRAGELLQEAKRKAGRGKWLAWLKANFAASPRAAQLYLQVLRHQVALTSNAQCVAHFGLTKAIRWAEQKQREEQSGSPFDEADFHHWAQRQLTEHPRLAARYQKVIAAEKRAAQLKARAMKIRQRVNRWKFQVEAKLRVRYDQRRRRSRRPAEAAA